VEKNRREGRKEDMMCGEKETYEEVLGREGV